MFRRKETLWKREEKKDFFVLSFSHSSIFESYTVLLYSFLFVCVCDDDEKKKKSERGREREEKIDLFIFLKKTQVVVGDNLT